MSPDYRTEITLLGHVFRLRCRPEEESRIQEAASRVNGRLRELGESGIVDSLRAALMAAFHFAYEMQSRNLDQFRKSSEYKEIQERLISLVDEIDTNLEEEQE
jgi:cell division protein ZapA (FtsZ GTPase activity inhibitor)